MKVKIGELTKIKTGKLDANAASEDGQYPFFTCSREPLKISTYSYDCECVLVAGNGDLNVKLYIDSMLMDAGWTEGKDWMNEVEISGMPNKSGIGFADYVLYDDMHRPLAVIEAKRTCVDVAKGRQPAKLYAEL